MLLKHRFLSLEFKLLIYPKPIDLLFEKWEEPFFPKKAFYCGSFISVWIHFVLFSFWSRVLWLTLIDLIKRPHRHFSKKIIDLSSLWVICYHFLGLRVFQMWNDDRSIRFFLNQKPLAIKIKCSEQQYRVQLAENEKVCFSIVKDGVYLLGCNCTHFTSKKRKSKTE